MGEKSDLQRYFDYFYDERNSAWLYRALSDLEGNPKLAEFYKRLAITEENHANVWAGRLSELGVGVPTFRPSWRTRLLIWLAKRFGPQAVLPTLVSNEEKGMGDYQMQPEAMGMSAHEQSHARLLRQMSQSMRGGMEGGLLAAIEGRHRAAGGNALRAAVLGANDGLVSNFSLVMGVAGAELSATGILITGLAGLLAGAISMALGEWISVQSSRELYQKQITTEEAEIVAAPEEEVEELTLIYQARGLSEESARQIANQIMGDRQSALETLAREELSIDPRELGGSAWEAALASFLLFSIGALIPVIPYTFLEGINAVIASAALSAAGLFGIGAAITLFTGKSVLYSGARQMLFGLAAAAITYLIGRLIGVNLIG